MTLLNDLAEVERRAEELKAPTETNCPFYGHHMHVGPSTGFLLIAQGGNECAAIRAAYSPCEMEILGLAVDWRECPVIAEIRIPRGDAT